MSPLPHIVTTLGVALLASGCAHSYESSHVTVVEGAPPSAEVTVEVPQAPAPAAEGDVQRAPPRLSRTITLGQGQPEAVYGTPPPQAQASAAGGANVTVNNNVTVVNQPPAIFGGYYGGYGARGYGGYGGYGSRGYGAAAARDAASTPSAPGARGAWAPSGWEGAGRTAAPGGTPGVGGNFAPAPSFGPRQMK